ncbi:hypothetical protein QTO34_016628 [Cnephaeus nilssonii]|uniref:FZ domain-containing protein n=1 Tax=Cnephaeus nilssonii TaxID=3371016 RepID=A0AA40I3I0_CNENI|nr:hypothetical protein QTO34_016628 [Eptesicus nilssonii]
MSELQEVPFSFWNWPLHSATHSSLSSLLVQALGRQGVGCGICPQVPRSREPGQHSGRALPSPQQAEGRHPPGTGQERAAEPGRGGDGAFVAGDSWKFAAGRARGGGRGSPDVAGASARSQQHGQRARRGGRRGAAGGVLLALAAGLLAAGSASEYDYVSFQSDIGSYQNGRFYTKAPQCVDIPADLRLCHNVGYKKMVLPNLLEHETMAEVKQQASSWVPLLNKNCHIGTQVFLCSLFAPVCLDRPIFPCRWLCEAVRDSCEPVMQFFGFYWPEMLKCDKFPEGDVCIAMTPPNATEASKPQGTTVCPPCDNELKSEAIIEHLCASEFGKKASLAALGRFGIPWFLLAHVPADKSLLMHLFGGVMFSTSSLPCGYFSQADRWKTRQGAEPSSALLSTLENAACGELVLS